MSDNDLFFDWTGDDSDAWSATNLANGKQRFVPDGPLRDRYGLYGGMEGGAPEYDPAPSAAPAEPDALTAYIAELARIREEAAQLDATHADLRGRFTDNPAYQALLDDDYAARRALIDADALAHEALIDASLSRRKRPQSRPDAYRPISFAPQQPPTAEDASIWRRLLRLMS